ncbi:MAG: hypothetical protein OXB84_03210 [Halobacteriovoraceae bacterium]|nr:hypothetical protein [Halobacteriovoraceae bacterium]
MIFQNVIQAIIEFLVTFATDVLLPAMFVLFIMGIVLRALIFYTMKREDWFSKEFQKRVHGFIGKDDNKETCSFYVLSKKLLEKTFYELFVIRSIMKRRNPDILMSLGDRLFLIQAGTAWIIKDTLQQVRYLRKNGTSPKLLEISKNVFQNNKCFKKVLGVIPSGLFNDVLNILPGIFIIGGIFGTFLGIMKALPELGGMDLTDIEGTKLVMDNFLLKISFSMSTSILGIILSVLMNIINTILSPEKLFTQIVDRYENSLDILWNRCENNDIPDNLEDFDENKDPVEGLAANAVKKEIQDSEKRGEGGSGDYGSAA